MFPVMSVESVWNMPGRGAVSGISSTGGTLVCGYTGQHQELQLADELHRQQTSSELSQPPTPHERVTGMGMQLTMIGPLGDQTKFGQHLATKLLFISAMTGELEEAYRILMLGGVDVRFSGLTRELQAEVWECSQLVPY